MAGLRPYVAGEQPKLSGLIKLNTNENPYGPSPNVLAALRAECSDDLKLYPDPQSDRLKNAIARYYEASKITGEQIFVGNGSDEVLAHVFHALLKQQRPVLFPDISYSFYPSYCALYGIEYRCVPLDAEYRIRVDDYLADDHKQNGGIIFPNPNAPTGCALALAEIERLIEGNSNSVVVVDEAYVDFGAATAIELVQHYPNLLVTQSLSKSRSLAGLRIGLAIGHVDLIEGLERVKNSFNSYPLSRLALAGGEAAFEDRDYFELTRQAVIRSREALAGSMRELGFLVLPSEANFLFVRHPEHHAADIAARLRERSIIVRHFAFPRIEQFLRITVGTDIQCAALVDALRAVLAPAQKTQ